VGYREEPRISVTGECKQRPVLAIPMSPLAFRLLTGSRGPKPHREIKTPHLWSHSKARSLPCSGSGPGHSRHGGTLKVAQG
jgi:hypothetical protein